MDGLSRRHRDRAIEQSPPTLVDCGCVAFVWLDGSGIEIEYCPVHREAFKMQAVLSRLVLAQKRVLDTSKNAFGELVQAQYEAGQSIQRSKGE